MNIEDLKDALRAQPEVPAGEMVMPEIRTPAQYAAVPMPQLNDRVGRPGRRHLTVGTSAGGAHGAPGSRQ